MVATVEVSQPARLPDGRFQAVFDFLQFPLKIRNRRDGDRFQPFGMKGSKKVKDFLIDSKVPRHERDRVPILVSGDEVVWVVGYRTSERFKVRSETNRCLSLAYVPYQGYAD
jgi:tRNA(Ile)-lysidine synthase